MPRSASHEAEHEGDHEQNKRYPKEDFRAFHRSARDAAETEEGRHDSDHQKNDGPVKQANSTRPFAPNPYVSRLRELL
jgi:hypothetical protein